jgi:hypothetical protein
LVVPAAVSKLLGFKKSSVIRIILPFYKLSRIIKLDKAIKSLLLPENYKAQVRELDVSG